MDNEIFSSGPNAIYILYLISKEHLVRGIRKLLSAEVSLIWTFMPTTKVCRISRGQVGRGTGCGREGGCFAALLGGFNPVIGPGISLILGQFFRL